MQQRNIIIFFGIGANKKGSTHEVRWLIKKGQKFVCNQCEIALVLQMARLNLRLSNPFGLLRKNS